MMKAGLFAILLLGVVMAPGVSTGAGPSEEQRLRDLDKNWSAAAASKDAVKTASFYADDGSLMPFNGPIVNGKAKIQEAWAGLMGKPGYALHFEPTRVVVAKSHDMAYDIGTFELTMNDDKSKLATVVGKYLVAWKKQKNGEWKVEADCFNADK